MAVTNTYQNYLQADFTAPGADYEVITASPTPFAAGACRALFVGGAGNITVTSPKGNSVQFTGVLAGSILPIQAIAMTATSSSQVIAIY